eukprot:1198803-Rhodomonas_salina.2
MRCPVLTYGVWGYQRMHHATAPRDVGQRTSRGMLLCAVRYAPMRCPLCSYALSAMLLCTVRYAPRHCPLCSYALSAMILRAVHYAPIHCPHAPTRCPLCVRYAPMPFTVCSYALSAMLLRAVRYAPTRCPRCAHPSPTRCPVHPDTPSTHSLRTALPKPLPMVLRVCYALSGTDGGYAATRPIT